MLIEWHHQSIVVNIAFTHSYKSFVYQRAEMYIGFLLKGIIALDYLKFLADRNIDTIK